MPFASHVPIFDTVPVVDFAVLPRQFVKRPADTAFKAWDKMEELERRLDTFDWAAMVMRDRERGRSLVNDFAFSFITGFESALQVLKNEWTPLGGFDAWLRTLGEYDARCRGIRSLRNLDVHVRGRAITPSFGSGGYTRFHGGTYTQHAVGWRLPELSSAELSTLRPHGRKLPDSEIPLWNSIVNSEFASDSMRKALLSLVKIMEAACPC